MSKLGGSFETDPYPGKPKILFVGLANSSHTHSWIDLLEQAELNVRLFGLGGLPPVDWPVRTYVTASATSKLDRHTRRSLYPFGQVGWLFGRGMARAFLDNTEAFAERWLAQVIRRWQPDIIHTLGLDPASYLYFKARKQFELQRIGKWIVQARGGPELALHRLMPDQSAKIREVLGECDQLIADNQRNYEYALDLGLKRERLSFLGVVPGAGGINIERLLQARRNPPSCSRLILWPKAYECPQSKALPVFEAIKLAWDQIQPCEFEMLAAISETQMWYQTLPEEIRRVCRIKSRIPHNRMLELISQARVMLAPSLSDGVPNSMYEAMAGGAFPIVSPLETIKSLVTHEQNVLFARNLYPTEIAEALSRAMSDDALVDKAAERNLELVQRIANRATIGPRVVNYYQELAQDIAR